MVCGAGDLAGLAGLAAHEGVWGPVTDLEAWKAAQDVPARDLKVADRQTLLLWRTLDALLRGAPDLDRQRAAIHLAVGPARTDLEALVRWAGRIEPGEGLPLVSSAAAVGLLPNMPLSWVAIRQGWRGEGAVWAGFAEAGFQAVAAAVEAVAAGANEAVVAAVWCADGYFVPGAQARAGMAVSPTGGGAEIGVALRLAGHPPADPAAAWLGLAGLQRRQEPPLVANHPGFAAAAVPTAGLPVALALAWQHAPGAGERATPGAPPGSTPGSPSWEVGVPAVDGRWLVAGLEATAPSRGAAAGGGAFAVGGRMEAGRSLPRRGRERGPVRRDAACPGAQDRKGRRVVITAAGAVTALGIGVERLFAGLAAGRSGLGPLRRFEAGHLATRQGGEVDLATLPAWPLAWRGRPLAREVDVKAFLARTALEEVRAAIPPETPFWCAVGLEAIDLDVVTAARYQAQPVCPELPPSLLAGFLWEAIGQWGPVATQVSACAAGTIALGSAFRAVRAGRCAAAVAGGVDSLIFPYGIHAFHSLGALSERNDLGPRALAPFDRHRSGTLLGEGAAFLVLEEREAALARGRPLLAEVLGYGAAMDAHHPVLPDPTGDGLARAMRAALADAGLEPAVVEYVNAHGTGTRANDVMEWRALQQVFGERAGRLPVSSTKAHVGHLLTAAGAVETVACLWPYLAGFLPPTLHLVTPDPECPVDGIAEGPRPGRPRVILKASAGLGGQNACLLLGDPAVEWTR